jgi:predicted nucleic acid-binding Zn ribbon protein
MDIQNCRHCGEETEEGEAFCSGCRSLSGEKKKTRRIWVFSIQFSAVLLFLTGLMVWQGGFGNWGFSLAAFWGKPAAVINGESIPRDEFKGRMMSVKSAIERQYGKSTFTGERGEALLGSLAQVVLDGMLEERLVAQEARKLKVEIRQDQVEGEVQRISKEMYGDWEKFQDRLREEGISADDLRKHIHSLLLYNALREAKTPAGADPEVSFNAWMIQAKQKAELVVYETGNRGSAAFFSGGSCCAPSEPSGGSSAPPGRGGPLDSQTEKEAKKAALEAFQKGNQADQGVSAQVTNYGCHIQVDIQKEGKVVKSYSYQGGKAFEIS